MDKSKIRDLVACGRLIEALDELPCSDEVMMLFARYYALRKDAIVGTIKFDDETVELAKISQAILSLAQIKDEPNQFSHVMVDIETLGNRSNSVILSLGAVEFDISTGRTGREFYKNISLESCMELGLTFDASTIKWWFEQSDEARKALFVDPYSINSVLVNFANWINPKSFVWGNSARFDLGLLQDAYNKMAVKIPWEYWNERDVRTLLSFYPNAKKEITFDGTVHNALHDCHYQIKYCSLIYNKLKI
jgi:hypothetical protein